MCIAHALRTSYGAGVPTPPNTSLRLSEEILARADRLVPLLQSDVELQAASPQLTRSAVLRLALLKGLALLEQQTSPAEVPRGKTAPRRR